MSRCYDHPCGGPLVGGAVGAVSCLFVGVIDCDVCEKRGVGRFGC